MKVQGEKSFSVPSNHFGVVSTTSFTLAYSVDGDHYTQYDEATNANENLFVANVPKGAYYKLVGNTGTAYIQY